MSEVLDALLARVGEYRGEGKNHEDQAFIGTFELARVVDGRGVSVRFKAVGIDDGETYHQEFTLIGQGADGDLDLITLSNNSGKLQTLSLRRAGEEDGSERTIVFGVGAPEATDSMRMEIAFDLWPGSEISYRYAWGVPGGEFAPRSSVRMKPNAHNLSVPS